MKSFEDQDNKTEEACKCQISKSHPPTLPAQTLEKVFAPQLCRDNLVQPGTTWSKEQ